MLYKWIGYKTVINASEKINNAPNTSFPHHKCAPRPHMWNKCSSKRWMTHSKWQKGVAK